MHASARKYTLAFASILAILTGCASRPAIDVSKFGAPHSVVIEDIPDLKNLALIGVIVPSSPGFPGFHFSRKADYFFSDRNVNALAGDAPPMPTYANAGILADVLMQQSQGATQAKATGFDAEVQKRLPGFDLRRDFLNGLRKSLEARGMRVSMSPTGRNDLPRLRWPATDEAGNVYPLGSLSASPPVDADMLIQVSPIAFYNAPGGMNAYRRNVTVGVALYNGRTRQFLGKQTLVFSGDMKFLYMKYDTLVAQLGEAAPALRNALLSLVPQIADLVSARPLKP